MTYTPLKRNKLGFILFTEIKLEGERWRAESKQNPGVVGVGVTPGEAYVNLNKFTEPYLANDDDDAN